jgi:putative hydrolase of the HAD superfamily
VSSQGFGIGTEPLRAVTFDATHTLLHAPRLAEIYAEVLARHGLVADIGALRQQLPIVWHELSCQANPWHDRFTQHPEGSRGFWHGFLERVCSLLELGRPSRFASAELYERFARPEAWEVYPDVVASLRILRGAGISIGLISNWDERLPRLLERLDLAPLFDAITLSSAVGCEKPHPQIFLRCLESLGVAASDTLHIGDHAVEDVEGAEAAGLKAALLKRPRQGGIGLGPDDSMRRLLRSFFPRLPGL